MTGSIRESKGTSVLAIGFFKNRAGSRSGPTGKLWRALMLAAVVTSVSMSAHAYDVLWWDSTPTWGSQAPDSLRQAMSDYLTANSGGVLNSTYVSSAAAGQFAAHMASNSYDVIVFDTTTNVSYFNAADLAALVSFYEGHRSVLTDGILYIRSIVYNASTVFPGINGSSGGFTLNEVHQLAAHGGGMMIGTDHNCCQIDANKLLGAVIPGAVFSGITYPSVDGQFNGDDLLDDLVVVSPFDLFTHWDSVPSEAITPTGNFTDVLGNSVTLYSQVDVADDPGGGTKYSYISTTWEPGGVAPEFDCNDNLILDSTDIASGTSDDVNQNGIPDECEDCNENGVLDDQDIADGTSDDCNENAVPDECDIAEGSSEDADGDGIPDECNVCGDGVLNDDGSEECDDGNNVSGDGCSEICEIEEQPPPTCDVDGDGDIDRNDVGAIFAARNTSASGPDDPRDADGDGIITVNDGRACVLECTNPRCAP